MSKDSINITKCANGFIVNCVFGPDEYRDLKKTYVFSDYFKLFHHIETTFGQFEENLGEKNETE